MLQKSPVTWRRTYPLLMGWRCERASCIICADGGALNKCSISTLVNWDSVFWEWLDRNGFLDLKWQGGKSLAWHSISASYQANKHIHFPRLWNDFCLIKSWLLPLQPTVNNQSSQSFCGVWKEQIGRKVKVCVTNAQHASCVCVYMYVCVSTYVCMYIVFGGKGEAINNSLDLSSGFRDLLIIPIFSHIWWG